MATPLFIKILREFLDDNAYITHFLFEFDEIEKLPLLTAGAVVDYA